VFNAHMAAPQPSSDLEQERRTAMAAERTWLAWWRTAIAAAVAGLGVGRLLPEVVTGTKWPYVVLGTGYCLTALGLMIAGGLRQSRVRSALGERSFVELDRRLVVVFTVVGALLTASTSAVVLASA
jgi:inner membrane protein YidH